MFLFCLVSAYRDKILGRPAYKNLNRKILFHQRSVQEFKKAIRLGLRPTFSEFVQYILDENDRGELLDEHWIPVYRFCNPCQVNRSWVRAVETSQVDVATLELFHR